MAKKNAEPVETEELTQQGLVDISNLIEGMMDDIKSLTADKNELIAGFATRFGIQKKELNAVIKKYLAWKADRAKFNSEECMVNTLVDLLTGEKCITKISEEEFRDGE